MKPLAGVTILDFTRLLPGPYCTFLLAGLGAEVIKVEDVGPGDLLRHFPPLIDGAGSIFRALNQGKTSVALDLKQPAGQAIAHDLAAQCDLVIEGFRPGVAPRLGIDFPTLSAANDRLVYCSISGYGQQDRWRDLPGHDLTYAAMTGLLDALFPDTPRVPGVQLVDAAVALLAGMRVLAALHNTSHGPQYLDVSLADAARALMPGAMIEARGPGPDVLMETLRGGERNDVYLCADGRWLALSPVEDPFWHRLLDVLVAKRLIPPNQPPDSETLHAIFRRRPASDWFDLLSAAGIPCAPVRTVTEAAIDDPPAAWDNLSRKNPAQAPTLGEHTIPWLQRLGYSDDEISRLEETGVIRTASGS